MQTAGDTLCLTAPLQTATRHDALRELMTGEFQHGWAVRSAGLLMHHTTAHAFPVTARRRLLPRRLLILPTVFNLWQYYTTTPHQNRFTARFPGPPGWAGARRELLDFMVQRQINRGRHTDHPAGRNSIRTNQCAPPPSPIFLQAGCPSCRPTNSVKELKAVLYSRMKIQYLAYYAVRTKLLLLFYGHYTGQPCVVRWVYFCMDELHVQQDYWCGNFYSTLLHMSSPSWHGVGCC